MEQAEHHNDEKMMEMAYFFVKNSTKVMGCLYYSFLVIPIIITQNLRVF